MPYKHQWLDEENGIIQWEMYGEVTWSEFHDTVNAICEMIDTASQRVYIIVQDTAGVPDGNALPHAKTVLSKFRKRKNLEGVVVVASRNTSAFVKHVMSLVKMISQLHITTEYVTSIDEARDFISKQHQSQ